MELDRQVTTQVDSWSVFRDTVARKGLLMVVEETTKFYLLKAIEGRKVWIHRIWKSTYLAGNTVVGIDPTQENTDQTDFEANYKETAETNTPTREMNRDGKLYVHQTPTPFGATTYLTSQGDDYTDRNSVGGGDLLVIDHSAGAGDADVDVDFNCTMNKTWIYSGFATWQGTQLDRISVCVCAKASSSIAGTNTNFTTWSSPGHPWDGKLILPATGDGDLDVTAPVPIGFYANVTSYDDMDVPRYWNATWNPATKVYDELAAAPAGDGEFNMFTDIVQLHRFANNIVMNGDNPLPWSIDSRDSQRLGDGMFIRLTPTTLVDDHNWKAVVTVFMHRERTI